MIPTDEVPSMTFRNKVVVFELIDYLALSVPFWLRSRLFCSFLLLLLWGCGGTTPSRRLPVLGKHTLRAQSPGTELPDTIYHRVSEFRFLNQDSSWISEETFQDKVYVADFFFTSCPTICPVMAKHMLKVYESYRENHQVAIISHSIDPEYDTVAVLRKYAHALEVSSDTWHFVTGDKKSIYDLAIESYLSIALEDEAEPGGFLHSGYFLLVDKQRRIRGVYDGTSETSVDTLIQDIDILLKEYE